MNLPRYDIHRSYAWNYEHAPEPGAVDLAELRVPEVAGEWRFCGRRVGSPLGMPAGPLLNGRWCLYYAALGFDVVTYKTVRSRFRPCYELPNLQPVLAPTMRGGESEVPASAEMLGSWAVSFGMPSMEPDVWRRDIDWTRRTLPPEKLLSVSVVGTMQPGWTLDDLAADYALCARWAVESGADCIEANLSCPNVQSRDGQLYQNPNDARTVAAAVREAIAGTPLLLKIGHVTDRGAAEELVTAFAPYAQALAMVNCLSTMVRGADCTSMFGGQPRGIGGRAILEASVEQVGRFVSVIRESDLPLEIIGVGGASSAEDVERYLRAGAGAVHIATAAMLDPAVGIRIRGSLAAR